MGAGERVPLTCACNKLKRELLFFLIIGPGNNVQDVMHHDKVYDTLLKMVGDNLNLFHALGQDINNTADVYIT